VGVRLALPITKPGTERLQAERQAPTGPYGISGTAGRGPESLCSRTRSLHHRAIDHEALSSVKNPEALLSHVRGLFAESPGLRLTPWQFQRFWSLDADQARLVIDHLVESQFLRAARDGTYVRRES
jgi:hypothetical protein